VLVVVLLVLLLARIAVTRTAVIKRTPLDIPLLLFIASGALSTVFAENRNVALLGTYSRYDGLLTLVTYAALFWLAVHSLASANEARSLVHVLIASGCAAAVVAIVQSLHDSLQYSTVAPAFGSLGNPNVLGAFLALVIALAVGELLVSVTLPARILLASVVIVCGLALMLSLSRSSWFATAAAIVFLVVARPRRLRALAVLTAPVVGLLLLVVVVSYASSGSGQLERTLVERVMSTLDPHTLERARTGIWGDSLRLVASRPVVGYGPDNVGLVFPRFQTGDWGMTYALATGNIREPIDKAHAELLQVAATQGAVGVATYLLIQLAFLRALWRARRIDQAVIAGAGWIAYQLVLQLNFAALAAALPFWIFAAAATALCDAVRTRTETVDRRSTGLLLAPAFAAAAAVSLWGIILPYLADSALRQAVDADYAGRPRDAQPLAAQARQMMPWESVYAVEVGNIAFERHDWPGARSAYQRAAELGTFNPLVYRNLALADLNLGLGADAKAAARKAVELDRFDAANQALLAEFTANKP